MVRVFISQPMHGKSTEDIAARRLEIKTIIWDYYKRFYGEEKVFFVDSFIRDGDKLNPLLCLGSAIQGLSRADVAVFDYDWFNSRGCRIEHSCCDEYGIETKFMEDIIMEMKSEDDKNV